MDEEDVKALVEGSPIADPRLRVIQRLVGELIETYGRLSDESLNYYREHNLGDGELIEAISIIGLYTWGSFVNNLARTEIDPMFETND